MRVNTTDIIVRGYHLDLFGHVNNARFLEFLEEGRWAFVEGNLDLGEWQKRGIGFSVVNININYRRPAFMGEILEVRTWISHIGKTSGTNRQEIVLKGTDTLVVDANVKWVMVDIQLSKAIPIEGELRAAFENMA